MTDIEKLKILTNQIEQMLVKRINPSTEEFTSWKTKVERTLERIYGENSKEYKGFKNIMFSSWILSGYSDVDAENIEACHAALQTTRAKLNVYLEELEESEKKEVVEVKPEMAVNYNKVFIVHGHDGELKEKVARMIENQGIEAVILHEKSSRGRTIIEKIEAYAKGVNAAICLFTADDEMSDGSKRARQNVVFETGYFCGKIGRNNTIILAENDTLNLSDLDGIVYIAKKNWEIDVLKELNDIGYKVDMNKLLGK